MSTKTDFETVHLFYVSWSLKVFNFLRFGLGFVEAVVACTFFESLPILHSTRCNVMLNVLNFSKDDAFAWFAFGILRFGDVVFVFI